MVDTFSAGSPTYSTAPAVGAEAAEVIVTGELSYSMVGIKEDDLKR